MKSLGLPFEPIQSRTPCCARARCFKRNIEKQGQIGTKTLLHPIGEQLDAGQVHPSPATLVCTGSIRETITEHPLSGFQRRQDTPHNVLAPGCEDQQRLRVRVHVSVRIEEELAKGFTYRCATRLARRYHSNAAALEPAFDRGQVRSLAGAVDAFERDELSTHCYLRWYLSTARLCSDRLSEK